MNKKPLKSILRSNVETSTKHNILELIYGKAVTDIKAYGIDEFDFTPDVVGFSVGEFGYTVFEFGNQCFYVSVDGISHILPKRHNVKELPVDERTRKTFIGAVLSSVTFDGELYEIKFDGKDTLYGQYEEEAFSDRSYFDLSFPWV